MHSAELTHQLHLRFVRCHMEKTIKSSEVYYHSEVLELKKRERIVTFTKNNIHNSFHPCARQCLFRRHQSRQQMRANFYSATLGAIHLTQLQMHHLTFSHTAFRQRRAEQKCCLEMPTTLQKLQS